MPKSQAKNRHLPLSIARRLQIIEGHLKKVRQMEAQGVYCINILSQSQAVQQALKRVDELLLERHLHSCMRDVLSRQGYKGESAIKELLKVYRRKSD
ncbi:MAG: metal-sensing transcriptional repressor [Candidatus Kerfeldbacteria bacterium]|nr:metal-sensing transcriptional repressor [Candidatus Kerfeldbacteria bacterium]